MTREAMAIYEKKLRPHGIVVMHISNRHLELASVVAGIAAANGMVTRVNDGGDYSEDETPVQIHRHSGRVSARRRGFRADRHVAVLEAPGARSPAMGVDRRLFQHRRRDLAESG